MCLYLYILAGFGLPNVRHIPWAGTGVVLTECGAGDPINYSITESLIDIPSQRLFLKKASTPYANDLICSSLRSSHAKPPFAFWLVLGMGRPGVSLALVDSSVNYNIMI